MQNAPDAATAAPSLDAELLATVYGRLVRWHYIIAANAANVSPDVQARIMDEMMETLKEIAENPRFRAVADERARTAPPPRPVDEARIARLRARAAAGLKAKGLAP